MRNLILIAFIAVTSLTSQYALAQTELTWEMMKELDKEFKYSAAEEKWYFQPKFSPAIKKLKFKKVFITGHIIPVDPDGDQYVLSAFPNKSCFFCGAAGEESVIELRLIDYPVHYKMDEIMTFEGRLRLSDDLYELPYVLEDAIVQD